MSDGANDVAATSSIYVGVSMNVRCRVHVRCLFRFDPSVVVCACVGVLSGFSPTHCAASDPTAMWSHRASPAGMNANALDNAVMWHGYAVIVAVSHVTRCACPKDHSAIPRSCP